MPNSLQPERASWWLATPTSEAAVGAAGGVEGGHARRQGLGGCDKVHVRWAWRAPPSSFAGHACSPEPPPLAKQAVLSRVALEGGVHHKRLLLAPALQAGQVHGASVGGLAQAGDSFTWCATCASWTPLCVMAAHTPPSLCMPAHLQGRRCTKATWPPGKSATGSGCTLIRLFHSRMTRGSSASPLSSHSLPCRKWSGEGGQRHNLVSISQLPAACWLSQDSNLGTALNAGSLSQTAPTRTHLLQQHVERQLVRHRIVHAMVRLHQRMQCTQAWRCASGPGMQRVFHRCRRRLQTAVQVGRACPQKASAAQENAPWWTVPGQSGCLARRPAGRAKQGGCARQRCLCCRPYGQAGSRAAAMKLWQPVLVAPKAGFSVGQAAAMSTASHARQTTTHPSHTAHRPQLLPGMWPQRGCWCPGAHCSSTAADRQSVDMSHSAAGCCAK